MATALFHPLTLSTTDVQATTLWGKAFDWVMAKRQWSLGEFSDRIGKRRNEVRYWRLENGRGPGVGVLDNILPRIGCSWVEWGGILSQLKAIEEPNKTEFSQVEHELEGDSLNKLWFATIPAGMQVHSRSKNGKWEAYMKAHPTWTIIRDTREDAEAAMRVLAIQIIRLVRSYGVMVKEDYEKYLVEGTGKRKVKQGKPFRSR